MRDGDEKMITLLNAVEGIVTTDELRACIRRTLAVVEARLHTTQERQHEHANPSWNGTALDA